MEGSIQVTIRGAKNLRATGAGGTSDPYVVYGLVQNRNSTRELRRFGKRKAAYVCDPDGGRTRIMHETVNPVWKHRAAITVTREHIDSGRTFVAFQIFDRDTMGKDVFMGQATFSLEDATKGLEGKYPVVGREGKKDKVQGFLKLKAVFMPDAVRKVVVALRKGDSSAALQLIGPEHIGHKEKGASLLHLAAEGSCDREVLERIIDTGVDVNAESLSKKTPLALACSTKSIDNVRLLLDAQADPMVRDRNGATLLHFAAMGGTREIAELLIEKGISVNKCTSVSRKSPAFIAAHYGNIEVLQCLIEHDASVNVYSLPDRVSPLFAAVLEGKTSCVRALLDANADASEPNGLMSTPLVSAIRRLGTDPDASAVRALLDEKYNVDVCAENSAALHAAVLVESLEVVKLLLARGANAKAKQGNATPLSLAVERNLVEIALLLLQHGADVNHRLDTWVNDFKNVTALHIAVERQHADMVDLLLSQERIDVNCKALVSTVHESSHYTPLHCAVENNDKETVRKLLAANADPYVRLKSQSPEYDGLTPYLLAVKLKYRPIVKMLPKKKR